jgi:hypothetical protein
MENLTKLGLIFIVIGLILAIFTVFTTLILVIMGFLLLVMGSKTQKITNVPYPMFMACPTCGKQKEVGRSCPNCQSQPGY